MEFIREKTTARPDVKNVICDILDLDPSDDEALGTKLGVFDDQALNQILTQPQMRRMLNSHHNRGAIVKMVKNARQDSSLTVGRLINMISDDHHHEKKPKRELTPAKTGLTPPIDLV